MDDARLVEQVLTGDREAFAELVRRHQRWVTVVALRTTRNLEEADDLAQETFLRAYRGLSGFRGEAAFRTWLANILRNLLRDRFRGRTPEEEPLEAAPEPAVPPDQERQLLDDEVLQALRRAYDAIPAGRQREVVRMRFLEGKRLDEIAAALGLKVGTVKAHLFRGTRRLREALGGMDVRRVS